MNKLLVKYLKVILLLSVCIAVERFCHKKTRGFRPSKVYSPFSVESCYAIEPPSSIEKKQIDEILSQPFTFLGDGGQGYSFLSSDGQYVLKFFKLHHVYVPSWLRKVSLPGALQTHYMRWIKGRDKDKERMLSSCKIAYEHLPSETGVLHVHINPSDREYPTVTIYDAIGAIHKIELDKTVFALQRRAELAFTHLKEDLARHDEMSAKAAIDDFLTFLTIRCKKGVEDRDTGLRRNFGYIDGKMMEIDIGSFVLKPELSSGPLLHDEVAKKGADLRAILSEKYSQMLPYYDSRLAELTQQPLPANESWEEGR